MKKKSKILLSLPFELRVFFIIIVFLIIPIYFMFIYMNHSFANYMDEEISSKVVQTISNSEAEIYNKQENLINISNLFMSDNEFEKIMSDQDKSYYEKCLYFDSMVNNLLSSNLFNMEELKMTFFDKDKNIYTNWGVNYYDYTFMLEEDWILKSKSDSGYLNWNMFHQSPYVEERGKDTRYISLTRSFHSSSKANENRSSGTLIISMNVNVLTNLLEKYKYSEKDEIFIYSKMENLTSNNVDYQQEYRKDIDDILSKLEYESNYFIDRIQSNKFMIYYYTLANPFIYQGEELKVVSMIDYQSMVEEFNVYNLTITLFFILFSILLFIGVYYIARAIVKPVKDISNKVSDYQVGDILEYDYSYNDEIGNLYQTFAKMVINIKDLFRKLDLEYKIKEKYRFESLRAQINPHFIFNTLNSIRWMAIIRKQDNIVESIDAMTDILQYSMSRGSDHVTLEQEINSINSYIYIQNMRYGESYELNIDLPEELYHCQMIKFSLQPIVENCIIHGFKDFKEKGIINISGNRMKDKIYLSVENNGNIISDEAINHFEQNKTILKRDEKQVTGIGLANVDEIIRITYGEEYGLEIHREGNKTVICYLLPYQVSEEKPQKFEDHNY